MIISREYVTFRRLIESGDKGGKLFEKLLKKAYPEDMWDEARKMLLDQCLYQREMGWAFRGIGKLIEGFQKLDEESPYDNGYAMEDIWDAEVLYNEDGVVTLLLFNGRNADREIVKVAQIS